MALAEVFTSLLCADQQQDLKQDIMFVFISFMLYKLKALSKEEQVSVTPATKVSRLFFLFFAYVFHTTPNPHSLTCQV